jgi:hypothetical protein
MHSPVAPFTVLGKENGVFLVIAACACGGDCCMSASLRPTDFFTPDGDAGVDLDTRSATR